MIIEYHLMYTFVYCFCLENEEFERNVEFSATMDFDPAYPQVLLLVVKWYWKAEHLGEHLNGLYPIC